VELRKLSWGRRHTRPTSKKDKKKKKEGSAPNKNPAKTHLVGTLYKGSLFVKKRGGEQVMSARQ